MSEKKPNMFYVESVGRGYYCNDRFETLKEAEEYARSQAYRSGENYGIFKMVAEAVKPEIVNDVKIESVK